MPTQPSEWVNRLKMYHDEDWHTPRGRAIREVVFGMNDGLVTTVGFIAGVTSSLAGRPEGPHLILLTGVAEMVAGALSMFFGAYLSTKSQRDFFQSEIEREKREMELVPAKEREEIREIFLDMGFTKEEAEMVVNRVTSDKRLWLRFMMREELGLIEEKFDDPLRVGLLTGSSFLVGSLPPLLPYIFLSDIMAAFRLSLLLSLAALFSIGAGRVVVTKGGWLRSGLEVVLIGSIAAGAGFIIGTLLPHLLAW